MTKMESSANLINNLLLNLDNLKIQAESNANVKENLISSSLQDQLNLLKYETEKLTKQYTQSSSPKNKSKKIPPPIITGVYNKRTKFQTIDDILCELNNVSYQTYGGKTPSIKSGKGRKIQNSFVDPRRFSDPYKYTILSTLDETEDGEEEEEVETMRNTPKTPKTALPYYSRKKDYNKNLSCNTNLKVSLNNYITPKSAGYIRNRSYSQPERYTALGKTNIRSNLHESATLNYNQSKINHASNEYFKKLLNIENKNKITPSSKSQSNFIKPPRSSSINKHGYSYKDDSNSETSDSEPITEPNNEPVYIQYHMDEVTMLKKKGFSGLENKSSFQSDITLINEE